MDSNETLIQYLKEAYGKERELEVALQAHIAMTNRPPYEKRLKQHLKETKAHAKAVERRIKKLGGGTGSKVQATVGKALAASKGPLHMVRGHGEQEKMLKNAKTEYFNEHEEIANYLAIEAVAEKVGDRETAKVARQIRRDEERMAKFLEGQIRALSGAVAREGGGATATRKPAKRKSAKRKPAKGKAAKRAPAKSKGAKSKGAKAKGAKRKASSRKR